jgi:hypothetical protein
MSTTLSLGAWRCKQRRQSSGQPDGAELSLPSTPAIALRPMEGTADIDMVRP